VRRQMANWRGVKTVQRAIDLADPGAENFAESALREFVQTLGIGPPSTQFGLRAEGRTVFCDLRVGRHVFEMEGKVKYIPVAQGGVATADPTAIAWAQRERDDFITGFKLGMSHVTYHDLGPGRARAVERLRREYAATVARFGTDITDLAPYQVSRRR